MNLLKSYKGALDDDAFKEYERQFKAIAPLRANASEYRRRYNKRLHQCWRDYIKRPMVATKTVWELMLAGYTARFWVCKDRFQFFDYLEKCRNNCIQKGRGAKNILEKEDLRAVYRAILGEIERLENYTGAVNCEDYEISEKLMDKILKFQLYI